jgi:Cys-tRNA(Pro) deacylase
VKSIEPCPPAIADKHSGYQVGGTSPFGTRQRMPVYMEASIAELPRIYLNGGKRGYLIGLDPAEVVRVLAPTLVNVAVAG